jgi:predicted glycoside hydrolase/deacetylase ChbG (UPF0249 family)
LTADAVHRLIVNADDFAFTPAVTAGVLEAHAGGTVTSASMLVHCAGWDDGVRQAKATPSLGIGLHLNLLVGEPLTSARSLVDARSGTFLSLPTLVRRSLLGAVDASDVTAECEAQLEALERAGIACTHLDSHRHVHALPVIRRAVAAVAARRGLPLRRPLEALRPFVGAASQLHRAVIAASWIATSAGSARTRAADHFAGVSLQGSPRFAEQLAHTLDALRPGTTELMVHPGRVDDALVAVDAYTAPRERELAALTSAGVRERLRRGDVALIGFRSL